jgi:hypothetical protein
VAVICPRLADVAYLGAARGGAQAPNMGIEYSLRCKTNRELNIVKQTHLCCDIVKEFGVYFVGKPS